MPTNLLILYNQLLEFIHPSFRQNLQSIRAVFNRDFVNNQPILFNTFPVKPTPADGQDSIERLFTHLTTMITDASIRKRTFETQRSIRLHWIRHHFQNVVANTVYFKVAGENRVYILDDTERYVIILEPLREIDAYYLLSAYKLDDSRYLKIRNKYEKRGSPI